MKAYKNNLECIKEKSFRQIMFCFYRGPIYNRMRIIQLFSKHDSGTIVRHTYKRLVGSIWTYKKEVIL